MITPDYIFNLNPAWYPVCIQQINEQLDNWFSSTLIYTPFPLNLLKVSFPFLEKKGFRPSKKRRALAILEMALDHHLFRC